MENPCDKCKRRGNCTSRCFPKKDYDRGMRKKQKKRRDESMAATCRKCNAPIIWIQTPKGKWMPCDEGLIPYRQNQDGKDILISDNGETIRCDILTDGTIPTGMARIPHWKTCPDADSFRRKGGNTNG